MWRYPGQGLRHRPHRGPPNDELRLGRRVKHHEVSALVRCGERDPHSVCWHWARLRIPPAHSVNRGEHRKHVSTIRTGNRHNRQLSALVDGHTALIDPRLPQLRHEGNQEPGGAKGIDHRGLIVDSFTETPQRGKQCGRRRTVIVSKGSLAERPACPRLARRISCPSEVVVHQSPATSSASARVKALL